MFLNQKIPRLQVFPERFMELRGDRSNTELSKFLGISRQTVGFYCNGDRIPDALGIREIAERCGVSADWLLGLSDSRNRRKTEVTAMEEEKKEMTQEREATILESAIQKFGSRPQVIVAIEELSELQKELTKWLRGKGTQKGLMEEMADVSIMLNQLELIFGDPTEEEIAKLERLERLVQGNG